MSKPLAGVDLSSRTSIALAVFGMTWLAVILLLDTAVLFAQKPVVPKGVNGYTVTIDQDWSESTGGFRPVRVTIETNPVKAVVDDERFTIRATGRQYRVAERVTSTELIIPAGQKSGTAEFYLEEATLPNANSEILITTDRKRLLLREQISRQGWLGHPDVLMISDEFSEQMTSQYVCCKGKFKTWNKMAAVSLNNTKSTLPSFGYLGAIYNINAGGFYGTVNQPVNQAGNVSANTILPDDKLPVATRVESLQMLAGRVGFHYARPVDLPNSWIGLQGVDIIVISLDQFKSLAQKNELQRSNLEKWVTAGGALVVFDAGPKFKNADQIWPLLLGTEREFVAESKNSMWRVPNSKLAKLTGPISPNPAHSSNGYWIHPSSYNASDVSVSKWKQYSSPGDFPKSTPFGICGYLDGSIVAVDSDMSKWKPGDWQFLHNSIVTQGLLLNERVSFSEIGAQSGGINFRVPGVGEPPVKTFQVLIGLFLLFAGPVMVIILKRTRQMQYLFVAVPLLSAAVCSSLFLYAVVVDGSNRWGRCNSVTHIDHKTSMAVTHTRASYYCGRHPGTYELPADCLGIAYSDPSSPSLVEYEKGLMKLSSGKISARVPHEVTSARPYQTAERLLVLPGKTSAQADSPDAQITDPASDVAPRVQNRFGAEVKWALIRTEDGYFVVNDLPVGQTVDASVSKLSSGAATARSLANQLSPKFVGFRSRNRNRRYSSRNFGHGYEDAWGEDYRVVNLLKSGKLKELLSQPNSYVAIMEEFPLVAEQIEPVQYKMQLHVVRGQW